MMELLLQGLQIFLEPVNAELLDKFWAASSYATASTVHGLSTQAMFSALGRAKG
jgi:hypothetical protein